LKNSIDAFSLADSIVAGSPENLREPRNHCNQQGLGALMKMDEEDVAGADCGWTRRQPIIIVGDGTPARYLSGAQNGCLQED
jgi:hypothetical protein